MVVPEFNCVGYAGSGHDLVDDGGTSVVIKGDNYVRSWGAVEVPWAGVRLAMGNGVAAERANGGGVIIKRSVEEGPC